MSSFQGFFEIGLLEMTKFPKNWLKWSLGVYLNPLEAIFEILIFRLCMRGAAAKLPKTCDFSHTVVAVKSLKITESKTAS